MEYFNRKLSTDKFYFISFEPVMTNRIDGVGHWKEMIRKIYRVTHNLCFPLYNLRPSPHPKFYFCLRTSDLNETFRVDVSWAWYLVVKISA
jgi:hypothetical protein